MSVIMKQYLVFIDRVENRFEGASTMENLVNVFDALPSPDEITENTAND